MLAVEASVEEVVEREADSDSERDAQQECAVHESSIPAGGLAFTQRGAAPNAAVECAWVPFAEDSQHGQFSGVPSHP